jgi:release factor glutamine methyltransferase
MLDRADPKSAALACSTLREAAGRMSRAFASAGIANAGLDARVLAGAACGLSATDVICGDGRVLLAPELERIEDFQARRLHGEPVSRILGRREFWGLSFRLSPDTLDPRPETELLVEGVLDHVDRHGLRHSPLRILDLGTGTGCILGALLRELPESSGVAVDRSFGALSTAQENMRALGLLGRTALLCTDWAGSLKDASFDIVVSNPPYIGRRELGGLPREVAAFDPPLALDGGFDGLEAYRILVPQSLKLLRQGGFIVLETGYDQAAAVCEILVHSARDGGAADVRILKDLAGKNRAVAGVRQFAKSQPEIKKKIGNPAHSG